MAYGDVLLEEAELSFYEQLDGKKVAFIGSKCVILDRELKDRVKRGELWRVKLADKGTFFIGFPVAKVVDGAKPGTATVATLVPQLQKTIGAPATQAVQVPVKAAPTASVPPSAPIVKAKPARANEGPTTLAGMTLEPDNVIRPEDRVAFFVDGANIDNACTHAGFFLDWRKTLGYFVGKGLFGGAYYFSTDYMDDEDAQIRFHDSLAAAGFTVRSKPVKLIKDKITGQERVKGNVDIELALEMIAREDTFDVAVLFSGDSDFKRVLEILQSRGKRVFVVSSRNSVSRELIHAADKPVFFMEDFRELLERAA